MPKYKVHGKLTIEYDIECHTRTSGEAVVAYQKASAEDMVRAIADYSTNLKIISNVVNPTVEVVG